MTTVPDLQSCCKAMDKHIQNDLLEFDGKGLPYFEDTYALGEMMREPSEENTSDPFQFCPWCGKSLQSPP